MIQLDEHIFQMGWFNHQPDRQDPMRKEISIRNRRKNLAEWFDQRKRQWWKTTQTFGSKRLDRPNCKQSTADPKCIPFFPQFSAGFVTFSSRRMCNWDCNARVTRSEIEFLNVITATLHSMRFCEVGPHGPTSTDQQKKIWGSPRHRGMLALSPQYRADASQLTTTMPPDPDDVLYQVELRWMWFIYHGTWETNEFWIWHPWAQLQLCVLLCMYFRRTELAPMYTCSNR